MSSPSFLEQITVATFARVAAARGQMPLEQLREAVLAKSLLGCMVGDSDADARASFAYALAKPGLSFICELKQASPSKGRITESYDYLSIAREYLAAGAEAISVLTEPDFFMGSDEHLRELSVAVALPALRKDFVIDEYQIYQAKLLGASAVLLIVALLSDQQLHDFLACADSLNLAALVEVHSESELLRALIAGAKIVGVNNRDLKTFETDMSVSVRLREYIPDDCLFVVESGINTRADIEIVELIDADAVLIGETMMRAEDKRAKLAELRGIASTDE